MTKGEKITALLAVVAIAVTALIYLDTRSQANRPGELVSPSIPDLSSTGAEHRPNGPNSPTLVNVRNSGNKESLIQSISFTLSKEPYKSPWRETKARGRPPNSVTFDSSHRLPHGYKIVLDDPIEVGVGEWATLEVAAVNPGRVGYTYFGTVEITFDNAKSITIDRVELDVLASAP